MWNIPPQVLYLCHDHCLVYYVPTLTSALSIGNDLFDNVVTYGDVQDTPKC